MRPDGAIAAIQIAPSGDGLCWEALDVDFTVKELLLGIFGTKSVDGSIGREIEERITLGILIVD